MTGLTQPVQLPPSEQEASEKAALIDFLEERDLHEGRHWELLTRVFEEGFARSIQLILGSRLTNNTGAVRRSNDHSYIVTHDAKRSHIFQAR